MPAPACNALLLIAAPGGLHDRDVAAARAHLSADAIINERWLADAECLEALFVAPDDADLAPLEARIAADLAGRPVDVNIIPDDIAWRRKKLLVADMESTIVEQECLDEIAHDIGLHDRIAAITQRAMRGEIPFEGALRERVALLAGLDASILGRVYDRLTLMPGAETLVATMRHGGATTALVSGGFTYYTERIAARLGFDTQQANTLHVADGRIAGTVADPILGREAKRAALERLTGTLNLFPTDTLAVGDGANDLDMIRAAGLGVAFRAKPAVEAEARALPNGAVVRHGDLTALLYLQGYRRAEFVTAAGA